MPLPASLHSSVSRVSRRVSRVAAVAVLVLCVAACVSRVPAPIEERTPRPAAGGDGARAAAGGEACAGARLASADATS